MAQLSSHKVSGGRVRESNSRAGKARNIRVIRRIGVGIRADAIKGSKRKGRKLGFVGKESTMRRIVWGDREKRIIERRGIHGDGSRELHGRGEVERPKSACRGVKSMGWVDTDGRGEKRKQGRLKGHKNKDSGKGRWRHLASTNRKTNLSLCNFFDDTPFCFFLFYFYFLIRLGKD